MLTAKSMHPDINDLLTFLNSSPTAWHAVQEMSSQLLKEGFQKLYESECWNIQPGGRYFVARNDSSLCAFSVPNKAFFQAKLIGSHTDSPSFKLKPNAEFYKENMLMLGLETYGAPLITSWLNRDLGIAGRVIYVDAHGQVVQALVRLDQSPVVIPQLAIHLDRQVNENGLLLNKQEQLAAIAGLDSKGQRLQLPEKQSSHLERLLKEKIDYQDLLSTDLFLFPLEPARLMGFNQQMLAAYRLDNLGSVHAALKALIKTKDTPSNALRMSICWDNEEVGSQTAQGAGSPFLTQVLERITLSLKMPREDYLRLLTQSLCLSVDLAHAQHPNYGDKHEPRHGILMERGVVLKSNAQQRYASDAHSSAAIINLCKQHHIPLQKFVTRSDIPCGTTIGPIHASLTGMPTVDIGYPQLSMHSCRELIACEDHLALCKLLTVFFEQQ